MNSLIKLFFSFSVLLLGACRFTPSEGIPSNMKMLFSYIGAVEPKVTSVLPKNGSTGNVRNTQIVMVMNTEMDAASLAAALSIKTDTDSVAGDIAVDGKIISYVPKAYLGSNTKHTITLGTGAKSQKNQSPSSPITMTFSTSADVDLTPPSVVNTSPTDSSTGFPINAAILATFSETVNPSSFSSSMITLSGGSIAGTAELNDSTISFKPSSNLPPNTVISARIAAGLKDMAGNKMTSQYTWIFTTGAKEAKVCVLGTDKYGDCILQ
ncbi:MAG TPA: Ig-like domain-containing protein [Leptospiraceae bacterium]|nr:Ig-like domain-containing protein [Leptospiraceae bacterium]HMY69074.1 Ig-like domain-containing protein [Leptospiraceae bacterium]HNF17060.1 Ig-like domain-containing protein [Leptospiraceae bacterium]HNF27752.1 Ig-like domain-containing protein [Leptospiraceae bacterium]HNI99137.1 Ig-like domain-containing protein [Leptospiraceae bacterium]